MIYRSKLKGSFGRVYPLAMFSFYILCLLEYLIRRELGAQGYEIFRVPVLSVAAVSIFFAAMGIIQLYRYRLWINLFIGIFLAIGSMLSIGRFIDPVFSVEIYLINMLVLVLLVVINWNVLYSQERFEANARRLFRLTVQQIEETFDGYTERPYTAGKSQAGKEDLKGFARFASGKYIGRVFYRQEALYISFSLNKSILKAKDPAEVSYVAFTNEGEIKVQISRKDYHRYRERFSFDLLCRSMADIFVRFLDYYKNGIESRIITELKTAR